jgi:hypothetical protein
MTDLAQRSPGKVLDPDAALGINALPHNAQYEEQQKQNKNAEELKAQQAADAAAAANGAKPMAVRGQLYGAATNESGGITASGNEADLAGTPLGARRRAASRVLVG